MLLPHIYAHAGIAEIRRDDLPILGTQRLAAVPSVVVLTIRVMSRYSCQRTRSPLSTAAVWQHLWNSSE